jgi:hypothetical protein
MDTGAATGVDPAHENQVNNPALAAARIGYPKFNYKGQATNLLWTVAASASTANSRIVGIKVGICDPFR